jgi:hypothetical protein
MSHIGYFSTFNYILSFDRHWWLYLKHFVLSNICIYISLSLFHVALPLEHRASMNRFVSLQFLYPKTVGRAPWTGDQPVARLLPTNDKTKQNKCRQISMPRVEFEPTTPVFEVAKTVHVFDRAATVIGLLAVYTLTWFWNIVLPVGFEAVTAVIV